MADESKPKTVRRSEVWMCACNKHPWLLYPGLPRKQWFRYVPGFSYTDSEGHPEYCEGRVQFADSGDTCGRCGVKLEVPKEAGDG